METAAREGRADTPILALKEFNAWGARYAARGTGRQVLTYEGFRELCEAAPILARENGEVWVLFYRWDDTFAFEIVVSAAGCQTARFVLGGMPPLITYRVKPEGA